MNGGVFFLYNSVYVHVCVCVFKKTRREGTNQRAKTVGQRVSTRVSKVEIFESGRDTRLPECTSECSGVRSHPRPGPRTRNLRPRRVSDEKSSSLHQGLNRPQCRGGIYTFIEGQENQDCYGAFKISKMRGDF